MQNEIKFDVNDVLRMIDPKTSPDSWRYSLSMMLCSLRWKQTADEIVSKETIHKNDEGFNRGNEKLGVALASYAMMQFDDLNKVLSTKAMQKYKAAFSGKQESQGDYLLIPMELVPAAQQIVYTHRQQIVDELNRKLSEYETAQYNTRKKGITMSESHTQRNPLPTIYEALGTKKTPTQSTITSMKAWQASQRAERQQNMPKPSVKPSNTTYKRDKKIEPED